MNIWTDYKTMPLPKVLSFVVDNRGKTVPVSEDGNHVLIATNCIRNENLYPSYDKIRLLSEETYQTWFRAHPIPGDIIFVCKGTPGRVCMVPDPIDFCIAQDMVALRVNDNIIYNRFLLVILRSREIQEQIANTSVGDVIPHFKKQFFDQIMIPIPPMEIQRKIGDFYFNFSMKIENNKRINTNIENQALAIFSDMFPAVNDGEHTVGEYITPKRGKVLLSKNAVWGEVPVVAGGLEPATYHNESNTKAPVLTISASGANAGFVNLWHIPVWSSDSSYIDSDMSENVYFWYAMLKSRQKEIFDSQTGSAQPHIYPKHIAELSTVDLNEESIREYNEKTEELFCIIGENIRENSALTEIRDTVYPKLLSGDVSIDTLPIGW